MATTAVSRPVKVGGSFLIESCTPDEIFTPAELSDDQKLIGQTADEFITKEVVPLAHELEQHKPGLMRELVKKAGEVGLLGGAIPEEYGGAGLDKISGTVLAERLSGYAGFAVTHGGHSGIGTIPIVYFGTEEQKQKYLPKIATGELISCYCLSEPQAGSDAQNLLTKATPSPDGKSWILNGQKMWITNGGFADVFIIFAKVDGEKLSCFIVEKGYPGFKIGAEEKKMGIKGSSTVPIFFDNCAVPKENLLFEIGGGFKVAVNTLNVGRFNLGAYCLGGSKNVLAVTAKYAKERKAFGKTLADFGLIQEKLAEMTLRIFAVESMIYRSAGMIEAAMDAAHGATDKTAELMRVLEEYAIESSISKVYGSEALDFTVDEAVQIYGGYGFHEEYPVARAYRDSRINRIFEGTNEINRMLMVDMLLRRAVKGTLPVFAAATKLAAEVLAGPLLGGSEPKGPLGAEEQAVANAKKTFLLAGGQAAQKYREGLKDQQEILGAMANMLMETYAMESCLLRTQKAVAARGQAAAQAMVDATRAYIYDAADRVEREARRVLAGTFEGDTLRTQLAVLKKFHKRDGVGTIALRRNVAAAVLAGDRYPFEGK